MDQDTLAGTQTSDGTAASPSSARLLSGRVDRYVVIAKLGAGAMGEVYSAYDPALDRKLALKLLHRASDEGSLGRARLLREAQALARLTHPNVVTVHDVGEHEGRVFLAMEYVDGSTLRAWLAERARTWREIVAVFIAAGRGLAAAHAAGLIHRDFKPDNVMLDRQGRVLVMDFGLARAVDARDEPGGRAEGSPALVDRSLTRTGALSGTPAYMAPEQFELDSIDARTDQFAFCVALFEALHGKRPFAGETLAALAHAVIHGELQAAEGDVPGWLRRTVARGLANDPASRWPDMAALIAALEHDQSPRGRTWVLGSGLALVIGVGMFGWFEQRQDRDELCSGGAAELGEVWNPDRREAVRAAMLDSELAWAGQTWAEVEPALDAWADRWLAEHRDTCEDTALRHEQSETLGDLRMRCLADRRDRFAAVIESLESGSTSVLESALASVEALPDVERCGDPSYVERSTPVPDDPKVAEQVAELRAAIVGQLHLPDSELAGRVAAVEALGERVEPLDFPPLQIEYELLLGVAQLAAGHSHEAEPLLHQTYLAARRSGMDEVAMIAARQQVEAVGIDLGDYRAGRMWAELAAIETDRVGDVRDQAALKRQLGQVLHAQGELAEAEMLMREALALVTEPDAFEAALGRRALATVLIERREHDEAELLLGEGREIIVARLGVDHPANAEYDYLLGTIWMGRGDYSSAREVLLRALAGYRRAGVEDTRVADLLQNLGNVERELGNTEGAIEVWKQALAQREQLLGPTHPDVADLLVNLAIVLAEDDAASLANYERALAIYTAAGAGESNKAAVTHLNLGVKLYELGQPAEALGHLELADRIGSATLGETHPILAEARLERAWCLRKLGRRDEARVFAQRNLELALTEGYGPSMVGRTRELLARLALEEGKRDPAHFDVARVQIAAALALSELPPDERQRLELIEGELAWELGDRAEARATFERLRALPELDASVREKLAELAELGR